MGAAVYCRATLRWGKYRHPLTSHMGHLGHLDHLGHLNHLSHLGHLSHLAIQILILCNLN